MLLFSIQKHIPLHQLYIRTKVDIHYIKLALTSGVLYMTNSKIWLRYVMYGIILSFKNVSACVYINLLKKKKVIREKNGVPYNPGARHTNLGASISVATVLCHVYI